MQHGPNGTKAGRKSSWHDPRKNKVEIILVAFTPRLLPFFSISLAYGPISFPSRPSDKLRARVFLSLLALWYPL